MRTKIDEDNDITYIYLEESEVEGLGEQGAITIPAPVITTKYVQFIVPIV
jgi:uncharacterized protein YuzE